VDNAVNSALEICLFYLTKDFNEFGQEISKLQDIWNGVNYVIDFMNSFTQFFFNWHSLETLSKLIC
jgi:hypothetical protein